jgi:hypothetical protein
MIDQVSMMFDLSIITWKFDATRMNEIVELDKEKNVRRVRSSRNGVVRIQCCVHHMAMCNLFLLQQEEEQEQEGKGKKIKIVKMLAD